MRAVSEFVSSSSAGYSFRQGPPARRGRAGSVSLELGAVPHRPVRTRPGGERWHVSPWMVFSGNT